MVQGRLFQASETVRMRCRARGTPRSRPYRYVLQTRHGGWILPPTSSGSGVYLWRLQSAAVRCVCS